MKALTLIAEWMPRPEYKLSEAERETHKVKSGSQVWKNPHIGVGQSAGPTPKDDEVIYSGSGCGYLRLGHAHI
jgi:scyllo-inosose 3-dehydrogenase